MSGFYRFIRAIVRVVLNIIFRVRVVGIENVPSEGGAVLCSNHTSMTDIALLIAYCPRAISFMAKAELFKNKFLGYIFRKMNAFPVERRKSDKSAVKNARQIVEKGEILGIFPEGTRKPSGPPAKAKAGAAFIALGAKADIIPVSIYREGKQGLFSKTTMRFGKPIPYLQLPETDGVVTKSALSETTNIIMRNITSLWEMGY